MSRSSLCALLCVGWLIPAPALADSTLVYEEAGKPFLVRIAQGRVRVDGRRGGQWLLFDSERRELTLVDSEKQEYRVIDEARAEALRLQVDGALAGLETQVAKLPPSLQEQARAVLGKMLPAPRDKRSVRLQATGQRGTAAGLGCEFKQLVVDEQLKAELCLTAAANLRLPAQDLSAVLSGQALVRSLADKADRFLDVDGKLFGDGSQIPLIYRSKGATKAWALTRIGHAALDPALLQVPTGYRERALDLPLR